MDIEIAEFDILNDMISNGTIGHVDELIVEFHKQMWGWKYPEEFRLKTEEQYDKITVFLDENFEKKKLLGLDKEFKHSKDYPEVKIRRNGGMWHWKK